ncbi:hypothetical protein B0H11DRAFT_1993907 [Mycena galericulata]|nr:hypothetical protein B0H11DRAFT_1993907 [Mycena galericulata]
MASLNSTNLPWPYNPDGHFFNVTGSDDPSHTLRVALVMVPDKLPDPWPMVALSFTISFLIALAGFVGHCRLTYRALRHNRLRRDDDPRPLLSRIRKPGIIYNFFRCIVAVAKTAALHKGGGVPSSTALVWIILSFFSAALDWRCVMDGWTILALLGAFVSWCLVAVQRGMESHTTFGYGSMLLIGGGDCVSFGEGCHPFNTTNATGGGLHGGLLRTKVADYEKDFALDFLCMTGALIGVFLIGWLTIGMEGLTSYDKLRSISRNNFRGTTISGLSIMFFAIAGAALIPALASHNSDFVGTQTATNGTQEWFDYFSIRAPTDGYGFFTLWVRQEWDALGARAAALFAWV